MLLRHWLTAVPDSDGNEHAVLSDGLHHIRLEIDAGTLNSNRPVLLRYRLAGIVGLDPAILTLRRFLHLYCHRRFSASLFPRDGRVERWVLLLRVHDALADGASHREIGAALFGEERIAAGWSGASDSLRSRVRRLVADARRMAGGEYRSLMSATRPHPPRHRGRHGWSR
ncbi:DNA -binding domain-containing protein [Sphingomonas sp. DT-204]|uniref:DNA -binding domain-containing protein n=1 Tax=Sphingomonas sp. DT-204 TaxID=3396166 RepID=UPI003F1A8D80